MPHCLFQCCGNISEGLSIYSRRASERTTCNSSSNTGCHSCLLTTTQPRNGVTAVNKPDTDSASFAHISEELLLRQPFTVTPLHHELHCPNPSMSCKLFPPSLPLACYCVCCIFQDSEVKNMHHIVECSFLSMAAFLDYIFIMDPTKAALGKRLPSAPPPRDISLWASLTSRKFPLSSPRRQALKALASLT